MRKHIMYLFLILSLFAFVTPSYAVINDTTLDNVVRLRGDGARQGTSVRVLKLVRYDNNNLNGASISSGDAIVYSTLSDDGVSVQRSSTTSNDGAFCGIAAMTIQTSDRYSTTSALDDVGGRNWGWIIVHGPANATVATGNAGGITAGNRFITSSDAATIGIIQQCQGAVVTGCVNQAITGAANNGGFFYDSGSGTDTSVEVFVENV